MEQLYRSENNKIIAGIFGGLGERYGADPVLLRLVFVLLTAFTGFVPGIIAYIVSIFVVPRKK